MWETESHSPQDYFPLQSTHYISPSLSYRQNCKISVIRLLINWLLDNQKGGFFMWPGKNLSVRGLTEGVVLLNLIAASGSWVQMLDDSHQKVEPQSYICKEINSTKNLMSLEEVLNTDETLASVNTFISNQQDAEKATNFPISELLTHRTEKNFFFLFFSC